MSRNGSGTYSLPAGNPVVTGTTIASTWANNTLSDIASALTDSVAADGQTSMTGNLNLNSNKIVNVADPTLAQDAATKNYSDTTYLAKASNLSDVANATTARTNISAAKSGANSDITSLTGLTTPLSQAQGGTGTTTGYYGFKNRIINGAMVIDQRNAGASVTPTSGSYTLDRWQTVASQASKFSVQQNAGSVTPPAGFKNYLGITSLSAYTVGSSELFNFLQNIEGYNIADLGWGTANAKTVTLSFQVYSSLTGTFGGAFNNGGSRSYPFTYSIPVANTWTSISITVVGDTSGTWGSTNSNGIQIWFSLGCGSSQSGTAGAWSGSNFVSATGATSVVGTNGATFYITGVQLEVGSTATSFDYRPYGTELALCQRYYQKISWTDSSLAIGTAASISGVNGTPVYFPQEMRTAPTITLPTAGLSAGNASFLTASGSYPATFGSNSTEATRTTGFSIKGTGYTSAFVVGNSSLFFAAGTATIQISAEL
jgi:hypothetical protein